MQMDDVNASVKYLISEIQKDFYHMMEEYPLPWVEYAYRRAFDEYQKKHDIIDAYAIRNETDDQLLQ